jgi:Uma2 family endonuclease
MSTAESTRLLTAEEFYDFCHLPENRDRHFELERGEVVEMSRPTIPHGVVCSNVNYVLSSYVRLRRRGYVCGNDAGIIWERGPDTVRGPDIVLFDEVKRFAELPKKWAEQPPRLIVEVRSSNDRWPKLLRRAAQFLRWGTAIVWVVDTEDTTVTVLRPNQIQQVFEENEELIGGDELPDFRCPVAEFFSMPGA